MHPLPHIGGRPAGAGVDVLYVSELLGHNTPTITMNVYQYVRRERLEGAMNTISEAIHG